MRTFRSPNPLVDSRRPFDGAEADLNPPGFVWHPIAGAASYEVRIGPDSDLSSQEARTYSVQGRTLWRLPEPLPPGTWYWAWRALGCGQDAQWSETFSFLVTEDTPRLALPPSQEVIARIAPEHPRHLLPARRLDAFRTRCRGELAAEWERLKAQAEERLAAEFTMTEPPFLPDRARDHDTWGRIWKDAMVHSRQFGQDAQLFALVYLIGGEERFGHAAIARLLEFARWDPDGSTSIPHNDEPHMSVINLGPRAYDWAYGLMTDDERATIREALRVRAIRTYDLLVKQDYGVIGSSSHSGRMLGFLGELCIVLAHECDEVVEWLDFVLPTTAAMYPWWGAKDGGWAEGVSYSTAYVNLFLHFIFGLREAAGVDFYRKPFFRRHGEWRTMCVPPNACLVPFGDGRTNGRGAARSSWSIQRHLGRIYGDGRFLQHADQILAANKGQIQESAGLYSPLSFLTPPAERTVGELPKSWARLFGDIGWLVIRTNLREPDEDIRFMMRCSPYGTTSHSHADHNSFVLEAFGEPLAIPSGLYTLYGSAHHHGWTRQTRAHNAVTFDGAGQIVRSPDAVGRFTAFHTDPTFTYAVGDATAAYGDRVRLVQRSVLCMDNTFFVLVDRMQPSYEAMWCWHLHAARPMALDEERRRVLIRYDRAALDVVFCHRKDMCFHPWEGFELAPFGYEDGAQLPEEAAAHHLDVFPESPQRHDTLLTVLFPRKRTSAMPEIVPLLEGVGEGVRVRTGEARYRIFIRGTEDRIASDGCCSDGEVVVLFEEYDPERRGESRLRRAILVKGTHLSLEGAEVDPDCVTVLG